MIILTSIFYNNSITFEHFPFYLPSKKNITESYLEAFQMKMRELDQIEAKINSYNVNMLIFFFILIYYLPNIM
jgi:hypothetical protein